VLVKRRALVDKADRALAIDRPRERPQQAGDDSQQARLAGAVRPHDLQRLARSQLEREAAEQHPGAAAAGKILHGETAPFHRGER